jgi:hypothetical protein
VTSRQNVPLEEELLVTYINRFFPNAHVFYHVRLGHTPDVPIAGLDAAKSRRLMMPGLPELDAIVIDGTTVYLVEAKVKKEWENLGKMLIYKYLLPKTPGWELVDVSKLKLLLVMGQATDLLKSVAASMGVSVAEYMTPRVREILTLGWPSQR